MNNEDQQTSASDKDHIFSINTTENTTKINSMKYPKYQNDKISN